MKRFDSAKVALSTALATLAFAAPAFADDYSAKMVKDIQWQDAPSIGPGAKTAVIFGDPKSAGPFVMRLKLPPNTTVGLHTHPTTENVTVLSGTLYFAAGDKFDAAAARAFGAGSFFSIGQGKPMFAYTKDKETIIQLHGDGPWGITYLEAGGQPRTAAKK